MTVVVPCLQFIDRVGHSCYVFSVQTVQTTSSFPGVALGPVLDMPVVVQRHMHSPRVSRSSTTLSWRRGCLLGPGCSENHEIPQLQSIDRCRRHCWAGPADSTCAVCVKTAETPQLHASYSFLDKVVDMPVVFNDKCPYLSVQKTAKVPQSQRSF